MTGTPRRSASGNGQNRGGGDIMPPELPAGKRELRFSILAQSYPYAPKPGTDALLARGTIRERALGPRGGGVWRIGVTDRGAYAVSGTPAPHTAMPRTAALAFRSWR